MRSLNKHPFRTPLLVVAMSGALVASAAFAQTAGTSTPDSVIDAVERALGALCGIEQAA